jgi:cyclopropane-fatty-acyl-phospholipid synthase
MNDKVKPAHTHIGSRLTGPRLQRWARQLTWDRLARMQWGCIVLTDTDQEQTFGPASVTDQPRVHLTVHDPAFYTALVLGGDMGAAEAYMTGHWSCDHPADLIRILVRNMSVLTALDKGWARLAAPARKLFHWLHRNTLTGSRRNIIAHYDLGNDFYRLFLDPTMTYSCGVFAGNDTSLEQASMAKYDRLCRKLALTPRDHVVEIGTGWGGFALHAAAHYGCRVTTTTLSREQYQEAQQRVQQAGLESRITLLLKDYRDLQGPFDKLVSIEMIEAVGHAFQPTFFKQCSDLLKPDGLMALQAITITDQLYARHVRRVDFIKRYIFPGSCLTSVTHMCHTTTKVTDMRLLHLEDITPHYARTLRLWRERFFQNLDQVKALGYDDAFIRMWDYYLSYCEGAFAERYIGNVQMVWAKPLCRRAPILMDDYEDKRP